jgi:hypothetical protein
LLSASGPYFLEGKANATIAIRKRKEKRRGFFISYLFVIVSKPRL